MEAKRQRGGPPRGLPGAGPRPSILLTAFFAPALAFLLAAAAAAIADAVADVAWLHWLALHLALLGGVSQLVLGAGQFFSCAFLATSPPSRRLLGAQLAAWNGGTVLVAVGVPARIEPLTAAGAILIAAGLVLFAAGLRGMQRRSLQRARWAVRWYYACAACLGAGALLGIALAGGTAWSHGSLVGAHLAFNLAGWMGTAIVGTLHTFFPSLTQTQLRFPRLQGPTFAVWLLGVCALAEGAAFDAAAVVVAGWLALAVAAGMLCANVIVALRATPGPLSLPARLVALGQLFLPCGLVVALAATVADGVAAPFAGPARGAVAVLLLAGWIGLTVAGSLLHLLALLAHVRRFAFATPAQRPGRDRLLSAAAGVAIAALALARLDALAPLAAPAAVLTVAVAAALAAAIAERAVRAFAARPAPHPGRRPA